MENKAIKMWLSWIIMVLGSAFAVLNTMAGNLHLSITQVISFEFVLTVILIIFLPYLVNLFLPVFVFSLNKKNIIYFWEHRDEVVSELRKKHHNIDDYSIAEMKKEILCEIEKKGAEIINYLDKIIEDHKESLPSKLTTLTFESLAYVEDNQNKLFTENTSEYVKSFLHLNTSYYAVTVFIIKEAPNGRDEPQLLFVKDAGAEHPDHRRYKPVGKRLPRNSIPENFIKDLVWEAVSIDEKSYRFYTIWGSKDEYIPYAEDPDDKTKIMKHPIAVQQEFEPSKDDEVPFHLDFIYLLQLNKGEDGSPVENPRLNPIWKPFSEVKIMADNDAFCYPSTQKLAKLIIEKYENKQVHPQPKLTR